MSWTFIQSAFLVAAVLTVSGCSALAGEEKPSPYVRAQATCLNVLGYDHRHFEACVLDQMDYERTQDRLDQAEIRERWQAIAGATAAALQDYGQPYTSSPGYSAPQQPVIIHAAPRSGFHHYSGPNGDMVTCHTMISFTNCF